MVPILIFVALFTLPASIHCDLQCEETGPRDKCDTYDFGNTECVSPNTGVSTSGLAASRRHPGFLYSVQDDGSSTIISVLDETTGAVVSELTVLGVTNVDWEDLAVGVCQDDTSKTCIYILDAGDEQIPPENCIYVVEEPVTITSDADVASTQKIDFSGWNAGGDDCCTESLFIDPEGNLFFFSREYQGQNVGLYKLEREGSTYTPVRECVVTLPSAFTGPDAADLSPDGCELLIRFHDVVYHVCIREGDYKAGFNGITHLPGIPDPCGTSIAWSPDGGGFYTSNESPNSPLMFNGATAKRQCSARGVPGPKFDFGQVLGNVNNPDLAEVSGMAFSRDNPDFIYLVNGGSTMDNCIYVIQADNGFQVGRICVTDATNTDWQDVAVGPLVAGGPNYIHILDGGSANGGPANKIFAVLEPESLLGDQDVTVGTVINYDGSIGEVRGIAVTLNAEICITTYEESLGELVTLSQVVNTGAEVGELIQVAKFAHRSAYPGPEEIDISSDGKFFLIKNLDSVWIYPIVNNDFTLSFLNTQPIRAPYAAENLGLAASICPHSNSFSTIGSMPPNALRGYRELSECIDRPFPYSCLLDGLVG